MKKKFKIAEFDNDYHTVVRTFEMEFNNKNEAEKYCKKESWTGYRYILLNK